MPSLARRFIDQILQNSNEGRDLLTPLLNCINGSGWALNPKAAFQAAGEPGYGLGRPLALAGARLRLELMSPPPHPRSFNDLDRAAAGPDPAKAEIKVYLGLPHMHGDGLVAFFNSDQSILADEFSDAEINFGRLRLVSGEGLPAHSQDYFSFDNYVTLNPSFGRQAPWVELALLLDPLGQVSLESGLLPLKSVRLEPSLVTWALARLYHSVQVTPLLVQGRDFRPPFPEIENRHWTWGFSEPGPNEEAPAGEAPPPVFVESPPLPRSSVGTFGPPTVAAEGWLRLRPGAPPDLEEKDV